MMQKDKEDIRNALFMLRVGQEPTEGFKERLKELEDSLLEA